MKHEVFANTIGQNRAVTRLSYSIASVENGGEGLWPFLHQQAGGGKSHVARAYLRALAALGLPTLEIHNPQDFRADGETWDSLRQLVTSGLPFAIFIDEYHDIHKRPTVRMESFHKLLMTVADKGNQNKSVMWEGEPVCLNRQNAHFIVATNFPDKIDKSRAFHTRFDEMALESYGVSELTQILQTMLVKEGFREASENTLGMIARCGRGSARPMEKIIDELKIQHSARGKKTPTINREDVIRALQLRQMYPQGLEPHEVRILNQCKEPKLDRVILATNPDVEPRKLGYSKGFLIERELGLQNGQGFQATLKGRKYLDEIQKEGFKVA